MENVEYPCFKCEYFPVCGDIMRTEPCAGRKEGNVAYIGHYPNGKPIRVASLHEIITGRKWERHDTNNQHDQNRGKHKSLAETKRHNSK